MLRRIFVRMSLLLAISSGALILAGCSLVPGIDYQPAEFSVSGDEAIMTGVIDSDIGDQLEQLLEEHPQIQTIVMLDVEGSVDDEANLQAASYLRKHGLNTRIPANGVTASGGTDFFLAGVKRIVEQGALIGVHAWAGEDIDDPLTLPKNHPEHQKYLRYYRQMGIPQSFYWYTLRAAPADDIHWMTEAEILRYRIRR